MHKISGTQAFKAIGVVSPPRMREVLAAMREEGEIRAAGRPEGLQIPEGGMVIELPDWVRRYGVMADSGSIWLLCEPAAETASTFPSQLVLDLPPGRYILDTFDVAGKKWLARESAGGGPLVAGLCFTGADVLVRIRKANK